MDDFGKESEIKLRKEFLEEYRKLCVKYDLQINACGCCNSPFTTELTKVADKKYTDNDIQVYVDGELIDRQNI